MNAPTPAAVECALRASIERVLAQEGWASCAIGAPPAGERWLALTGLDAPAIEALVDRFRDEEESKSGTPRDVMGNYTFRYLLYAPLLVAGYLFIAERRVLRLDGVWLKDEEWLQHARVEAPRLFVTHGDELAGEPGVEVVPEEGLTDALFAEIDRTYGPLIERFRAQRYVAVPNAWGSILDALAQGVAPAARELGYDEAWRRWDAALAGRELPVRRRPLRFSHDIDGLRDELAVRAGCCLWFTTEDARASEQKYCASCHLMPDERRAQIRRDYFRRQRETAEV